MAKKQRPLIGIPRGLLFYKYQTLWTEFFRCLGLRVLISPPTNKSILSQGANLAVDESCLSLKIFLGHCQSLAHQVDYLFIPRYASFGKHEKFCVKFLALPDIARNTIKAKILTYNVNHEEMQFEFWGLFFLGMKLTNNPLRVISALIKSRAVQRQVQKHLFLKQLKKLKDRSKLKVLLVSHSYTSYDAFLGVPIVKALTKHGVETIFADRVDEKQAKYLSKRISQDVYWSNNKELLGAIEIYKKQINGIIFLMTFPCGPDSLVINLCQNTLKIPMTVITLDELQAETGIKTRLESFIDILEFKKQKSANRLNRLK